MHTLQHLPHLHFKAIQLKKLRGAIILFFLTPFTLSAQTITLKNDRIKRILKFDGQAWRTVQFAAVNGRQVLNVQSQECYILPMEAGLDQGYSIDDFKAIDKPFRSQRGDTSLLKIDYQPVDAIKGNPAVPQKLRIQYFVIKGENYARKTVQLFYPDTTTVDRLEVERFSSIERETGGGRGQPIFIGDKWFTGLEYPAGYSRRTDGNTPQGYSRHYEKVGNYSFIDLQGRDNMSRPVKGMIRLFHFPGFALKLTGEGYIIQSKTAVMGFADNNQTAQAAFMQYLKTIWKKPVSFLHYNNWFDAGAKDLSGDGLLNVFKVYKEHITPYGVHLDALVADDGWQDRNSIWQPSKKYFPRGDTDLTDLSRRLEKAGVGFGLWLSLNGYTNNIDWGIKNGYHEAKPNPYFKQYGRYYSLSASKYRQTVLQRIPELAKKAHLLYYKHDFNELSDLAADNGHPADDRHGHEANVDAAIEILSATTKLNPGILQNLTNWIWFSPWWLQHVDYLWMLAGDDGRNGNWPELSAQARATTDRDTYIWRLYGDTSDRPLVPISRLMTHGIIRRTGKNNTVDPQIKQDNLQDWLDYVLMYYGRGTLLKEWYISPAAMSADEWKGLCLTDNWAKNHRAALTHTVYVGGRPDEGHIYGYIGWDMNTQTGVLTVRNPSAETQVLEIPFDNRTGYTGPDKAHFVAQVVYPYRSIYPAEFIPGHTIQLKIPGYATMAFEIKKGKQQTQAPLLPKITFQKAVGDPLKTVLEIPADVQGRCDLLLITRTDSVAVFVDGQLLSPVRKSKSEVNNFASYAVSGMKSKTARPWGMCSYDLLPYAGKTITITYRSTNHNFQSLLLAERKVRSYSKPKSSSQTLWPVTNETRRQVTLLYSTE